MVIFERADSEHRVERVEAGLNAAAQDGASLDDVIAEVRRADPAITIPQQGTETTGATRGVMRKFTATGAGRCNEART